MGGTCGGILQSATLSLTVVQGFEGMCFCKVVAVVEVVVVVKVVVVVESKRREKNNRTGAPPSQGMCS